MGNHLNQKNKRTIVLLTGFVLLLIGTATNYYLISKSHSTHIKNIIDTSKEQRNLVTKYTNAILVNGYNSTEAKGIQGELLNSNNALSHGGIVSKGEKKLFIPKIEQLSLSNSLKKEKELLNNFFKTSEELSQHQQGSEEYNKAYKELDSIAKRIQNNSLSSSEVIYQRSSKEKNNIHNQGLLVCLLIIICGIMMLYEEFVTKKKVAAALDRLHSEQLFRELAENLNEVFLMSNNNLTKVEYISPSFEQIWERSCNSVYEDGKKWLDTIYPDDLSKVKEAILGRNDTFEIEYSNLTPTRNKKWIHHRGSKIRDGKGKNEKIIGILRDITNKKNSEEEKGLVSSIIDASNIPILSCQLDGTIKSWNKPCESIVGFTEEEILGKTIHNLIPPKKRNDFEFLIWKVKSGESIHKENLVIKLRKGEDCNVIATITPINKQNQITGFTMLLESASVIEVKEEKSTPETETIHVSFKKTGVVKDCSNNIVNYTKFSKDEIIGSNLSTLVLPESQEIFSKLLEQEEIVNGELALKKKCGAKGYFSINKIYEVSEESDVIEIDIKDITESSKLKMKIENLQGDIGTKNEQLGETASLISTKLKDELHNIVLLTQSTVDKHSNDLNEDGVDNLKHIISRLLLIDYTLGAVEQYLNIDINNNCNEIESIDLKELLRQIIHELSPNDHLDIILPTSNVVFQSEKESVKSILKSLLSNAIKFSKPESGKIEIFYKENEKDWEFCIRDDGIGIKRADYNKIFSPYVTLIDTNDSAGIGLTLAKKVLERMGGKIWFDSAFTEGSEFYFSVPKVNALE